MTSDERAEFMGYMKRHMRTAYDDGRIAMGRYLRDAWCLVLGTEKGEELAEKILALRETFPEPDGGMLPGSRIDDAWGDILRWKAEGQPR